MLSGHFTRACRLICLTVVAAIALAAVAAGAPVTGPVTRLVDRIDDAQRMELNGHIPRAIAASVDLGAADPALPAERVVMLLAGTAAQEADLARFLHNVQTPGTAQYHHWLTPETFGQRFGVAPADVATVRTWLQSKGFRLDRPSAANPPASRASVPWWSGQSGRRSQNGVDRPVADRGVSDVIWPTGRVAGGGRGSADAHFHLEL